VEPGESCDDGNTASGDGCSENCAKETGVCGNGVLESGEECDDGNTSPGDGCSDSCAKEDEIDCEDTYRQGTLLIDPAACTGTCTIKEERTAENGSCVVEREYEITSEREITGTFVGSMGRTYDCATGAPVGDPYNPEEDNDPQNAVTILGCVG